MNLVASFNYSHSDSAVMIGFIVALGIAAALISSGRIGIAAAAGAVSWSMIGYLVGLAGRGDMTGMIATLYAVLAFPLGAVSCGVGTWIRSQMQPNEPPGKDSKP